VSRRRHPALPFAEVLDLLDVGVVVYGASGERLWCNERATALLGDPVAGPLATDAAERLVRGAIGGNAREDTLDLFGPPRRSLRVSAVPLHDGGAVAVVEDVSDRRRLDAVRRDFVANVSHELKTPIGALGVLADVLAGEEDPAVMRRLAARMQDEAMRVGRTIEDLLDLSRIEAEEAPSREPVPVHLVLVEATDRLRPMAEHRGVSVHVREPAHDVTVMGDRRQLTSALHCLVENAITYSDAGGEVVVSSTTDGDAVEVAVADSGIGIPARDLDRIFERFYRVDRARSRATGGTGLGLAIVRHVAYNHGGDVRVESREGEGSTFTLRLPGAEAG
jgi:two-component system sensor histidine kinase SenX3